MGKLQQFGLLLWKNYLLQRRKVLVTFVELVLPALFALILIFIRLRIDATYVQNVTAWDTFRVDSPYGKWNWVSQQSHGNWSLYYSPNTSAVTAKVMNRVIMNMDKMTRIIGS